MDDDGTVLSNAKVVVSDLLGGHRYFFNFQSVSSFSNCFFQYVNLKKRYNWGYFARDFRDFYLAQSKEIAVIGPRADPATAELLTAVFGRFLPNKVVVGAESPQPGTVRDNPLLEGREMLNGKPTAYVCQNYACQLPVTTPEELAAQLEG